jgi:hypothetical protein
MCLPAAPARAASRAFTVSPSSPRTGQRATFRTTKCSREPCRYQWQNRPRRGAVTPLHKASFLRAPRLTYVFRTPGRKYVAVRKKAAGRAWTPWRYIDGSTGRQRARGISVQRARRVAPGTPAPAPGGQAPAGGGPASGAQRWVPPRSLTWYWQLRDALNLNWPVAAYDIDGMSNTAATVAALHAQGKRVICYVNVGASESFRPDYAQFPAAVKGNALGAEWPGENWLDIRAAAVKPIMAARFQLCAERGFDAVEPDNMDGYSTDNGFALTAADQLAYNRWVADAVHALGMAVFHKNDSDQVAALQPSFDGAITEECNTSSDCGAFTPYLTAGKPVLNAEYGTDTTFCAADNASGIMGARFALLLDGTDFQPCW